MYVCQLPSRSLFDLLSIWWQFPKQKKIERKLASKCTLCKSVCVIMSGLQQPMNQAKAKTNKPAPVVGDLSTLMFFVAYVLFSKGYQMPNGYHK